MNETQGWRIIHAFTQHIPTELLVVYFCAYSLGVAQCDVPSPIEVTLMTRRRNLQYGHVAA